MSVKERPILFSAPMVRAILDGSKTQTRRVVKPQPKHRLVEPKVGLTIGMDPADDGGIWYDADGVGPGVPVRPPWRIGDRLWVRETHAIVPATAYAASTDDGVSPLPHRASPDGHDWAVYREGWSRCAPGRWRPSIHMPRWASRILLEVTDVRVERVQEISEEDARAEGCAWKRVRVPTLRAIAMGSDVPWMFHESYVAGFSALWDSINGKRGFGWEENPWVWVVSFRMIEP